MPRLGSSICAGARTGACAMACEAGGGGVLGLWLESVQAPGLPEASQRCPRWRRDCRSSGVLEAERSKEHTSELQSPKELVCRLLLEKKKNTGSHPGRGMLNADGDVLQSGIVVT